jgi:hypothetical protein
LNALEFSAPDSGSGRMVGNDSRQTVSYVLVTHKTLSKTNIDSAEPLQTLAFIDLTVALLADY